jgi:hypothetical protein
MGIDIYARWHGQTEHEQAAQYEVWLNVVDGGALGYLREAYHGEPYATRYLFAEAFKDVNGASIPLSVLRERLPKALEMVEERERKLYQSDDKAIAERKQSFIDFIELCERKEKETGKPVVIGAWF